jgi:DNA-binding NarL/FixJ family response regulator
MIITNSVMPAVNGARLVASLRRQFPAIPVLHLNDQGDPRPDGAPV